MNVSDTRGKPISTYPIDPCRPSVNIFFTTYVSLDEWFDGSIP